MAYLKLKLSDSHFLTEATRVRHTILLADIELLPLPDFHDYIRWVVGLENQSVPVVDLGRYLGLIGQKKITRIENLVRAIRSIGDLVHEVQKERGASALYLGSRGRLFGAQLVVQCRAADERAADLKRAVAAVGDECPALSEMVERDLDALAAIGPMRQQVLSMQVDIDRVLDYYTELIDGQLAGVELLAAESQRVKISRQADSLVHLLRVKECAGLERALLSYAFAQGYFASGVYGKLEHLNEQQQLHERSFLRDATAVQQDLYQQLMRQPVVAETRQMRKMAEAGYWAHLNQAQGMEIDPAYWFRKQTDKIELFKSVESKLVEDLLQQVRELERADKPCLCIAAIGDRLVGFLVDAVLGLEHVQAEDFTAVEGEVDYVLGNLVTGAAEMRQLCLQKLFRAAAAEGRRASLQMLLELEDTLAKMQVESPQ